MHNFDTYLRKLNIQISSSIYKITKNKVWKEVDYKLLMRTTMA